MEPGARGQAAPRREQQPAEPTARGGRWRRGTAGGRGARRWYPARWWRTRWRIEPGPGRPDPALDRTGGAEHPARPHGPPAPGSRAGGERLVTAVLWLLVALQGTPPDVTAHVDRAPLARALLDAAAPPPRNDRVALTVIIPSDSVLVGQQLDVLAAAWFPRELRQRLRSEEHTSELQSHVNLVCRLLLEKKKENLQPIIETKKNYNKKSFDRVL